MYEWNENATTQGRKSEFHLDMDVLLSYLKHQYSGEHTTGLACSLLTTDHIGNTVDQTPTTAATYP